MKFFYCKSAKGRSGRWSDAAARAKSGISLVSSENRVYSIHKHLDLSRITDSVGNNDILGLIRLRKAGHHVPYFLLIQDASRILQDEHFKNQQEICDMLSCLTQSDQTQDLIKTTTSFCSMCFVQISEHGVTSNPLKFQKESEKIEELMSNEAGDNEVTTLQYDHHESNPFEEEMDSLKKQIISLQESKHELEEQLSMYNFGLKEQESFVKELQILVEAKAKQIEILSRRIEFLEGKNRRLETLASEHAFLKSEVELAKLKMKEMKSKIRRSWRKKKEAFNRLQQQIATQKSREAEMLRREIEMVNIIEGLHGEMTELKRTNLELLNEKTELMNKLDCINESIDTEKEATEKAIREVKRLRIANAELQKQIDLYRNDRRNDIEELIYLRWINACLKHELQKKHGSKERILGTIKHDKRDAKMVDEFGVDDQKKSGSGYDSDGSTTAAEVIASYEDVNSKKRTKATTGKLLLKIKNWMNNEKNNKKIHDEDCSISGDHHKIKTQNSDAYANVSSCGKLDYATDVSVLPRSRDFLLQTAVVSANFK